MSTAFEEKARIFSYKGLFGKAVILRSGKPRTLYNKRKQAVAFWAAGTEAMIVEVNGSSRPLFDAGGEPGKSWDYVVAPKKPGFGYFIVAAYEVEILNT